MQAAETTRLPPDTLLADELAVDDVIDMANLTTAQTGVAGTIFVSTVMGGDAPRIQYFVRPGGNQPSFWVLIADPPRLVANGLPVRVLRQMAPQVIQWTALKPQVNAFIQRLTWI